MNIKTTLSLSFLALTTLACQPTEQSEPLATFGGQVSSALESEDQGDVDVAISWFRLDEGDLEGDFAGSPLAERVAVNGQFPSEFTMEIYEPPPSDVFLEAYNGLAIGIVTAIRADASNEPVTSDLLAVNEDLLVIYTPSLEVLEGLGVPMDEARVGYNLYRREGVEIDGYDECAAGRDAQIQADCDACECEDGGFECEACFTCDRAANIEWACHIDFKQHFMAFDTNIDLTIDPEIAQASDLWSSLFTNNSNAED